MKSNSEFRAGGRFRATSGVVVVLAAVAVACAGVLGQLAAEQAVTPAGLVAYWPLDQVVDGRTPDASGRGHDAVLKAEGALPQLTEGIVGSALRFSPAERQWLEVPYSEELDASPQFTVMAWVKVAARDRTCEIVCNKGDRSGDPPWPGWRLRFFWTRAVFQIGTPDGQEHAATSPEWDVMPGYWTHVAGTYDGQTLRVYTNGVLRAEIEAPGGVAPRKRSAVIGNYVGRKNAYPMDGLIDEVRIYNRALTVEEILAAACEGMLD